MGIIQKQSIQSSVVILIGFAIGAINIIVLAPKLLTVEQLGLTRIISDAALTLSNLATIGCIPVIYKFIPFYRSYLPKEKNDLPFVTLIICLIGFLVVCFCGYLAKDIIVRKYSEKSALFVEYSYLVYPFCFFMLLFIWLESFAWSFRKGVLSNGLKETVFRLSFTILLVLFGLNAIQFNEFIHLYSLSWLIPAIILLLALIKKDGFRLNFTITSVTQRLKGKMFNFGLFIFGASFLNLLSKTADTFIISSKSAGGLKDAAVFTIATYVVTLMEVPQRSINSITVPVLAESWKNKDFKNISHIYIKSVSNLQVIGLTMFGLLLLNAHNLAVFLGKNYLQIEMIVLLMGIGKLIDLCTGANAQIIGTSAYWKVDFITNAIYTIIALPLNYILISYYGLLGAAYANIISLTLFNIMRYGFLWYKFKLQPYTPVHLYTLLLACVAGYIAFIIPQLENIYLDSVIRTLTFAVIFIPLVYLLKTSEEINGFIDKYLQKIKR